MPVIHEVKISKTVSHTIGVSMGTPNQANAVRDVMLAYGRQGYEVESVDGNPVHRCNACGGLIFNGEGVSDNEGKPHCAKCLPIVLDVVQPEGTIETPAYVGG